MVVLELIRHMIEGLTTPIIIGYGIISFLFMIPPYYMSFVFQWNKGAVCSSRRFRFLSTSYLFLLFPSLIYTSMAFGYNWIDYFIVDGKFNSERILTHMEAVLVPILLTFVTQLLAINNEREITLNSSMLKPPKSFNAAQDSEAVQETVKNKPLTLNGNTKANTLVLPDIDNFFYAESNANYLRVVYYDQGIKEKSLRMTTKQLEETLACYPQIMRCHRAFLVNISNISYLEGTASKGVIHFALLEDTVPVSKTYVRLLSNRLKQA